MKHILNHIGIIPDGNRRWAQDHYLPKEAGYFSGLQPGLKLYQLCKEAGINEITYYGFTQDNTKRPAAQVRSFQNACVEAVKLLAQQDAELLVLGNTRSPLFPKELLPYTTRKIIGSGKIKLNFLVNYSWEWDLSLAAQENMGKVHNKSSHRIPKLLHSSDISRVDLIIRWGGRRRLSGFLPVQSVYADFYVIDDYWPDFKEQHFFDALNWYQQQDITLGG